MHVSVSAFTRLNCEWLIKTVIVYLMVTSYMDNCGNSGANTCVLAATHGAVLLLDQNQSASAVLLVTLNNFGLIVWPCADDISFEGVPYQLSTVS